MTTDTKDSDAASMNMETPGGVDRRSFLGMGAIAAAGALAVGAASKAEAAAPGYTAGETVETTHGRIRGSRRGKVHAFRGVPYGASTADSRFLPAKKPQPWTGVRDALEIGPRAPQSQIRIVQEWAVLYRMEAASEDCLTLNVWSKGLNDRQKRPVMVWLHGGGFAAGSAGGLPYDGTNMADKHDVVFVGVNHRLNVFGFLYLPEIGGEKYAQASNVGMLDIVQALEWVRDNIERFGGDPGNVTVLGQSGGGSKVSTLLGMPAAKGLFHRAIAQSGSQVRSQTTEQATRTARNVLKAMQIEPNQLDRLQQVPFYVLRDTLTAADNVGQFSPVMDGRTVPAHIFDPVATQISADVPLMIGSMETEVTWNTGQNYDNLDNEALRYYVKTALRTDDATADRTIALYRQNRPKASNLDLYLILAADASGFRVGTGRQADSKAALGRAPVYKYYWNWYSPVRDGELRCMHCMDIPFALNNIQVSAPVLGTGKELQSLADKVSGAWAAFARTGNPNHAGIPNWTPFTTARRETMVWNVEPKVVSDPHGDELRAVNAIIAQRPVQGG